jgi:hypothetical protein
VEAPPAYKGRFESTAVAALLIGRHSREAMRLRCLLCRAERVFDDQSARERRFQMYIGGGLLVLILIILLIIILL